VTLGNLEKPGDRNLGTDGTYASFLTLGYRGEAELSYIRRRFPGPTTFTWDEWT